MYLNLKSAMAREGVSIESLSAALGVHRNTIANKISGETPFTYDEVLKICALHFPSYSQSWLFKRFHQAEESA